MQLFVPFFVIMLFCRYVFDHVMRGLAFVRFTVEDGALPFKKKFSEVGSRQPRDADVSLAAGEVSLRRSGWLQSCGCLPNPRSQNRHLDFQSGTWRGAVDV